ncbi:MAG: hypothetical protein WC356_06730 [Candidatus Micrarchaeia archaeon]|jgi:hypothetical protein
MNDWKVEIKPWQLPVGINIDKNGHPTLVKKPVDSIGVSIVIDGKTWGSYNIVTKECSENKRMECIEQLKKQVIANIERGHML